jgi:hypothetical protein
MISTQWFSEDEGDGRRRRSPPCTPQGETTIIPAEWVKTYDHFLENIQDWCVSRQLWWGHQIPAWHGPNGEIVVARERPPELGEEWTQDPDVLDTWFSSALWPFSTLGWPDEDRRAAKFYPASDLETGYDILFFWVARMMMFGLHFMEEVPFRRVLLSGLIVDETGDKMSKVKGNVIDPLDLVHGATSPTWSKKTLPGAPEGEALAKFKKAYPSAAQMGSGFPAFGADAVRFTLATYPPSNKRIALAPSASRATATSSTRSGTRRACRSSCSATYRVARARSAQRASTTVDPLALRVAACASAHDGARHASASTRRRTRLPLLLERLLRLVPRARQAGPPQRQTDGLDAATVPETRATLAYVLEGSLRADAPADALRHRGALAARAARVATGKIAFGPYPYQDGERAARDLEIEAWMETAQGRRLGGPHRSEASTISTRRPR